MITKHDRVTPRTPSVITSGKYQGALITALSNADLAAVQREFFRANSAVQIAIAAELSRRRLAAKRRRAAHPRRRRRFFGST